MIAYANQVIAEIKTLPACRAVQDGIIYQGRILPADAWLTLPGVVPHPATLRLDYRARMLCFLLSEQEDSEAHDLLYAAILKATGADDPRNFMISIVPEADLLW